MAMEGSDEYPAAEATLGLMRLLADHFGPDGRGAVDTLTHSLQVATRAERAGADCTLVVAALCHDMGQLFSLDQHDRVVAAMLRGYLPPDVHQMLRHHVHFTARHWDADNAHARRRYRRAGWYALAVRFVDEWDVPSFDPHYPTEPLEHFEPAVREVFAAHRWPQAGPPPAPLARLRPLIEWGRRCVGRG